jgi:hypothetical protein
MGKLNILHHKEWHVYSKVNRDKVREDEKNAAIEEQKTQDKIDKANNEARLELLRKRAHQKQDTVQTEMKHINLFEEEEKFQKTQYLRSEKELDQKKWEDKHTWYLGETKDGRKETPWYTASDYRSEKEKSTGRERKEQFRLRQEDPLSMFKKASQSKVTKPSHSAKSGPKTVDQLRKERLERELQERNRIKEITIPASLRHDKDESFYNSQFNPGLVRKPRSERPH